MLAKQKELKQYIYKYLKDFYIFLEKEKTITAYQQHLEDFTKDTFGYSLTFLTVADIQSVDTETFISYKNSLISRKFANNTINARLSALRTFMGYMKFRKITTYEPSTDVKYIGNVKSDAEHYDTIPMKAVGELIELCKKERYLKKEKEWFIKLAVETGLRTAELLSLKKSNFHPMSDGIHVMIKADRESKGKGNQEWKEMIHIKFFEELQKDFFTDSEKLFTMDESTIRKRIQTMMEKLGYEGNYSNHSLKRSAVNNTMDFTNDPRAAQAKGKHANMKTTFDNYIDDVEYGATGYYSMQYKIEKDYIAEASHEDLLKAIDKLEPSMILLLQAQLQQLKGE